MTALDPFRGLQPEASILPDSGPCRQFALAEPLRQGKIKLRFLKQNGGNMLNRGKSTLVESALVLALMGILAGAIGGLAIGMATSPKTTSSTTTTH
jgi:hypothetical protein